MKNHSSATELWVAFYKRESGHTSITYSESVDQALCFGWIDGVRHSIDDVSYKIRFTPRKPRSIWSAVNIKKVAALTRQGLLQPTGIKAFESRTEDRSEIYSFEKKRKQELDPAFANRLKSNKQAHAFFAAQIPSYQRTVIHWIMSAKQPETRERRLTQLISDSEMGLCIPPMRSAQRKRPRNH